MRGIHTKSIFSHESKTSGAPPLGPIPKTNRGWTTHRTAVSAMDFWANCGAGNTYHNSNVTGIVTTCDAAAAQVPICVVTTRARPGISADVNELVIDGDGGEPKPPAFSRGETPKCCGRSQCPAMPKPDARSDAQLPVRLRCQGWDCSPGQKRSSP